MARWGRSVAAEMIVDMQRSVAIAGLSSGRFVELPGNAGMLYVARSTAARMAWISSYSRYSTVRWRARLEGTARTR